MEIGPVDPRDTRREWDHPVFRVYFWEHPAAPDGLDVTDVMWHSEELRVTGATDVHEVLAWASGPAGRGRRFQLYVEVRSAVDPGLVRLAGTDPTGPGSARPGSGDLPGRARPG